MGVPRLKEKYVTEVVPKLMKELGYGKGYECYTQEDLLPVALHGKKYLQADET